MKPTRALALLGLLALPAAAHAQTRVVTTGTHPDVVPRARVSITPLVGVRVPYSTGDYYVFGASGAQYRLTEERAGGVSLGANVEARVAGPLSVVVGAAYAPAEEDVLSFESPGSEVSQLTIDGGAMMMAKAGLSYRLNDPNPDNRRFHPSGAITIAPGMVWTDPDNIEGAPNEVNRRSRHPALNLGFDALMRLGGSRNVALQFGVEDYITFWDTDAFRGRDQIINALRFQEEDGVAIDYDYRASNLVLIRAGVSIRM